MNLTLHLMKLMYMTIREKALTLLKSSVCYVLSIMVGVVHCRILHSVDAITNENERAREREEKRIERLLQQISNYDVRLKFFSGAAAFLCSTIFNVRCKDYSCKNFSLATGFEEV